MLETITGSEIGFPWNILQCSKSKNKQNKIPACLLHHGLRVTFRKQYSSICQLVIRHYRGFNQITGPPICWFLTHLCFLSCIRNKAQTETSIEIIMIILLQKALIDNSHASDSVWYHVAVLFARREKLRANNYEFLFLWMANMYNAYYLFFLITTFIWRHLQWNSF